MVWPFVLVTSREIFYLVGLVCRRPIAPSVAGLAFTTAGTPSRPAKLRTYVVCACVRMPGEAPHSAFDLDSWDVGVGNPA